MRCGRICLYTLVDDRQQQSKKLTTSNDRAAEWLGFLMWHKIVHRVRQASSDLLLTNALGDVAVGTVLPGTQPLVNGMLLSVCTLRVSLEQSLGRFVNAQLDHVSTRAEAVIASESAIALHGHVVKTGQDGFVQLAWRTGC